VSAASAPTPAATTSNGHRLWLVKSADVHDYAQQTTAGTASAATTTDLAAAEPGSGRGGRGDDQQPRRHERRRQRDLRIGNAEVRKTDRDGPRKECARLRGENA
jgi:hypothetical protein